MASFGAAWQGNYYCQTEIILESQSIANNTSTFLVRVWFGTAAGWWIDANFNAGAYVGGSWVAGFSSVQKYVAGGSSALFVDTRQTRTHNNDGTLTLNISGNVSTNNVVTFNQWSGGNYTFPTIPRATDPNWSGNFEAGTAKTINLPRASSSFTHDVSYSFGSVPMTSIATGAGVTTSWTPDVSLLNQIPNAASGPGTLRVVTKNGGTVIGTKDKSFTLSAAPTVVPSISAVLWDDDNTTVKNNIGAFVKSASRIKGSVTAAGVYGSTITSKGLIVNGSPIPENTTISVETSGTIAASGTATDSRGRTVTQPATFDVLDYAAPKAVTFTVDRTDSTGTPQDDGQYLKLTLDASVQSLIVSSTQKNSMKIVVKTRPISSSTWTTRNTINTGLTYNSSVLISGGGIYLASSSYVVRVEITDKVSDAVETGGYASNKTVATGTVTLDLNGTNVGIGKFHENGKLDVAGDIYSDGIKVSKEGHTHTINDLTNFDYKEVYLDPAYLGGSSAKVVEDGVLSSVSYPWKNAYIPTSSRKVGLQRFGSDWYITGQIPIEEISIELGSGWVPYNFSASSYEFKSKITAHKLDSGLVVLGGLVRFPSGAPASGSLVGTLPPGYRPDYVILHHIMVSEAIYGLYIYPNGDIKIASTLPSAPYLSLDGVAFFAAGSVTWTDIGSGGSSFASNYSSTSGHTTDFGPPAFYKDPYGVVWFRGLVTMAAGTNADNSRIINLPDSCKALRYQHLATVGWGSYAAVGADHAVGALNWKPNSPNAAGRWISLAGVRIVTADAKTSTLNSWFEFIGYSSSWAPYNPTTFSKPELLMRSDGLRMSLGLMASGSMAAPMVILPDEYWPTQGRLIHPTTSNTYATSRLNMTGDKTISTNYPPGSFTPTSGGNGFFSIDGLLWVP